MSEQPVLGVRSRWPCHRALSERWWNQTSETFALLIDRLFLDPLTAPSWIQILLAFSEHYQRCVLNRTFYPAKLFLDAFPEPNFCLKLDWYYFVLLATCTFWILKAEGLCGSHSVSTLIPGSIQTLDQQFENTFGCSQGSGKGPDPLLGFGVSIMVVGQSPVCLLVHCFKSGCSVEFSKSNDNNMGKQVEVRWRKFSPQ